MHARILHILFLLVALIALPCREAAAQCDNTCASANDGECDDGGAGALYNVCPVGTDCADCGPRSANGCSNSCYSANDGECDDGGPGALYDVCALGTDCADCGPRVAAKVDKLPPPEKATTGAPGSICNNTCVSNHDNECDDGGPNSDFNTCTLGTDCADCGMRVCSDTCASHHDGECDDGGPSSKYNVCELGTDCSDCGVR